MGKQARDPCGASPLAQEEARSGASRRGASERPQNMEKSAQILGEKSGKPLLTTPWKVWKRRSPSTHRAGAAERDLPRGRLRKRLRRCLGRCPGPVCTCAAGVSHAAVATMDASSSKASAGPPAPPAPPPAPPPAAVEDDAFTKEFLSLVDAWLQAHPWRRMR